MAGQDGKPSISMEGVGRDAGDILHQEDGMVNAPRDSVQGSGEQVWALEVYKGDKPDEEEIEMDDDESLSLSWMKRRRHRRQNSLR
jgi:hypothetical protein